MNYMTLISTDALAAHLADPDLVIVDCRHNLSDVDAGANAYRSAHLPGAFFLHLDRDLSGPKTGKNGRHPLPEIPVLAATLGRLGIDRSKQVVAYDQNSGMWASRLWWTLRWLGHDRVAVLDGGVDKWTAERRPLTRIARGAGDDVRAARPRALPHRHRRFCSIRRRHPDRARRPRA
jgi:thiosulfate/3-mercaptopyruvate sulfurtransferase